MALHSPASPMSRIADEVFTNIIFSVFYLGREFSDDIEYDTPPQRNNSTGHGHAAMATNVLHVSRRFFRIGVEVLWRNVVVRSGQDLSKIADVSCKYGQFTWRLELRMGDWYDPKCVDKLFCNMHKIKIFIFRTYHARTFSDGVLATAFVARGLTENCQEVRHIQLDSYVQPLTEEEVCAVILSNPQLTSLRVSRLPPQELTHVPEAGNLSVGTSGRSIHTLSFGVNHWTFPSAHIARAQDSILYILTQRAALNALSRLHLLEFSPRVLPFLTRYGSQIRGLTFPLPVHDSYPTHEGALLQLCPTLEDVVLISKDWRATDIARALPTTHSSMQKVTLVCCKAEYNVPPAFMALVRQLLCRVRDAHFPALRKVLVEVRGGCIPNFRECDWFGDLQTQFKNSLNKNSPGVPQHAEGIVLEG